MAQAKKGKKTTSSRGGARATGKSTGQSAGKAAAEKRAASSRPPAGAGRVAAGGAAGGRSEFELTDHVVETALQTGEHSGLLEDYFGAEGYAELRQLAREAAARRVRGAQRVLILPGIMGSKIGKRGGFLLFDDVYWLDPADVATGVLARLALDDGEEGLEPLGAILFAYLKLKLRLKIAGYDAEFYPFDWRRSIADLGTELVTRLEEEGESVSLVAHSMGGLVARWALGNGGKCRRLVMLGTPNFGSFTPVLTLRGTYPLVRKLAFLDLHHNAEWLAEHVFSSFPGLTQMLPSPERFTDVDLYDLAQWPQGDALRPRKEILDGVEAVQKALAPGAESFHLIAGVNQETVSAVARDAATGELTYTLSPSGDGTVPLDLALLPGVATYYVEETHGSLPNNGRVARAVAQLLDRGTADALPDTLDAVERREGVRRVAEADLRVDPYEGRRGGALSRRELRHLLEEVAAPGARGEVEEPKAAPVPAAAAASGFQHTFDQVVVGRRRQHRLELTFAYGSITEVDCRAIALGIFRDVVPSGAARALDERVGGAITEVTHRRMFSGYVGEIFILPTGRHKLATDLIAFVGLGPYDTFSSEVLQVAAENIIRTFINTRVEEFATVLFGGASGGRSEETLRNLLTGFLRGLKDADHRHSFRRVVLCEMNRERYLAAKEELFRLSSTPLCQDVEITFAEEVLPEPAPVAARARRRVPRTEPTYLIVRQEARDGDALEVRSSVLTAGAKATVVTGAREVSARELDALREEVVAQHDADFSAVGQELARLLLADEVLAVLPWQRERHLVVVHDAPMSRVPWDVVGFAVDGEVWHPAAEKGLSHRYAADNLSVAKWLERRLQDEIMRMLLVVNPTQDLDGAVAEGKRIRTLLKDRPGFRLDELWETEATRSALLAAFSSGEYDIVHYAGHAWFDENHPSRSGLLCHGAKPLTGADLASLGNLPTLVFCNACESGRVRGGRGRAKKKTVRQQITETVGLAEAFMRGGIANFMGTYWPVGDAAAETFAATFYGEAIRGASIGDAMQAGRGEVVDLDSNDWANYILYGNPDFALKVHEEEP